MNRFLIDTDILSYYFKVDPEVVKNSIPIWIISI